MAETQDQATTTTQLETRPSSERINADARDVVLRGEQALNVPPDGSPDIRRTTAEALMKRLEGLKTENPELADEHKLIPQQIDSKNTRDFLKALRDKHMREAGITDEAGLNNTLLHLWAIQDGKGSGPPSPQQQKLGETAALYNLVAYACDGEIPGSSRTTTQAPAADASYRTLRPHVEKPWDYQTQQDPDRFFANNVYLDLMNNGQSVSARHLLGEANPAQKAAIEAACQKLGIDTAQTKDFTRTQVGQIAAEIMTAQAAKVGIAENGVTQAVFHGTYTPHLDDMFVVREATGEEGWSGRFGAMGAENVKTLVDRMISDTPNTEADREKLTSSYSNKSPLAYFSFMPKDDYAHKRETYLAAWKTRHPEAESKAAAGQPTEPAPVIETPERKPTDRTEQFGQAADIPPGGTLELFKQNATEATGHPPDGKTPAAAPPAQPLAPTPPALIGA